MTYPAHWTRLRRRVDCPRQRTWVEEIWAEQIDTVFTDSRSLRLYRLRLLQAYVTYRIFRALQRSNKGWNSDYSTCWLHRMAATVWRTWSMVACSAKATLFSNGVTGERRCADVLRSWERIIGDFGSQILVDWERLCPGIMRRQYCTVILFAWEGQHERTDYKPNVLPCSCFVGGESIFLADGNNNYMEAIHVHSCS
jgi:hypothetical protein